MLPEEEWRRMSTFRDETRRLAFVAGRLAARQLLAERLDCSPREVPLEVRPDGSIGLRNDAWYVSISHSGRRAVAGVSPRPIGIDTERIQTRPVVLFRFMLHPGEYSLIDRIDLPDDEKIVLFWALKEAVLKGRRSGLRQTPKALRLSLDLENGSAQVATPGDDPDWTARFKLQDGFVTAVAWSDDRR